MVTKPIAVHELERRLGRLKGDLAECEAKAEELRALILHVGETLRLYASDPGAVRPIKLDRRGKWFTGGQGTRSILGILRTAEKPLTNREIENRLMVLHDLDERARSAVQSMVRGALHQYRHLVRCEGERPKRWRIA